MKGRLRGFQAVLAGLAAVLLSGCYNLTQPIISASQADPMPGLEGAYQTMSNDPVVIEQLSGNEFLATADGGRTRAEIRALDFGRYHLLQWHDASGPISVYRVNFASITRRGLVVHQPQGNNHYTLAQRHGLTLDAAGNLSGDPGMMLLFLEELSDGPMSNFLMLQY